MSGRKKVGILLIGVVALYGGAYFRQANRSTAKSFAYPAPRIPAHRFTNLDDEHLMKLARIAARQSRSETRLGLIRPGQKTLMLIPPNQDQRVLKAIITALRERGVEAVGVTEAQIFQEAFGSTEELNNASSVAAYAYLHVDGGVVDGVLEGYLWGWPQFLREDTRKQGPRREGNEHREVQAAKIYLDKHPDYKIFLGRSSLSFRKWSEKEIGSRYLNNWHYPGISDLIVQTSPFPDEILRLLEDRVLEVLPWAEEVRINEPEGTDLTFTLKEDEAELWYKGAFEPPNIEVNPFAGSMGVNQSESKGKIVVPAFKGTIAGHAGHAGYYPLLKLYIEGGLVRRVEGGGKLGELWRQYLENPILKEARFPGMPQPGYLYVYQGDLGMDPKMVSMGRPLAGRSGMIHWGFGIDSVTPELEAYAEKNNLPTQHGLHVHTFFPTYEIKLRDEKRRVKLSDKGHLTALDDPEVQALAARYGKADEVLKEEFIPQIPGINAQGDYQRDYASDPLSYEKRFWKSVLSN